MATSDTEQQELPEECEAAMLAVYDLVGQACGTGDDLIRELAKTQGINPSSIQKQGSEVTGCRDILSEGGDSRDWVVCRAWDLLDRDDEKTLHSALMRAWSEAQGDYDDDESEEASSESSESDDGGD